MKEIFFSHILVLLICLVTGTSVAVGQVDRLPWPPNPQDRRLVAEELIDILSRSQVPEAKELLKALPPIEEHIQLRLLSDTRLYFGEWRLADDGFTLWTVRVRNELIRHTYRIRFTNVKGKFIGSELEVETAHGLTKLDGKIRGE